MSRGPGRWQRLLLAALEQEEAVCVLWYAAGHLDGYVPHAAHSAVNRAAHRLARSGKARKFYVWCTGDVRAGRRPLLWLARPGVSLESLKLPLADPFPLGRPRDPTPEEPEQALQDLQRLEAIIGRGLGRK